MAQKVYVGLSGGVDSAVSAALLKEQGYDLTGVFIRIALPGYPCSAGEDKIDAMRVAAHLKIPFREIDLSKEYRDEVFAYTVAELAKGRTPNPDTLCNQKIKFGTFFKYAMAQGVDFVATGHYARVMQANSSVVGALQRDGAKPEQISSKKFEYPETLLFAAPSTEKDQSYFLWMVPEAVLAKTIFPIGNMQKSEVRALAQKFGLPNAARKDSQGLCFLGDTSITDMIARELKPQAGEVLGETGQVVGRHHGVPLYTLGQRHGFELFAHSSTTPARYVIEKNVSANTIVVSTSRFPTNARETHLELSDTNWIGTVPAGNLKARYRYHGQLISAKVDTEKKTAVLAEPHYVPLGQSLVLYEGERCVGGGVVDKVTLL